MAVDPAFMPNQPDPDADWCPLPILHHEPYNTWESWNVWNMTSHLLHAGVRFCAKRNEAARTQLYDEWTSQLQAVQASSLNSVQQLFDC